MKANQPKVKLNSYDYSFYGLFFTLLQIFHIELKKIG